MDIIDFTLILLYLACVLAACSVLWSVAKRLRIDKEMQTVQKDERKNDYAPFRLLAIAVWGSLMVIVSGAVLLFRCDLASVMTSTMLITLVITMLVVAWASTRRK